MLLGSRRVNSPETRRNPEGQPARTDSGAINTLINVARVKPGQPAGNTSESGGSTCRKQLIPPTRPDSVPQSSIPPRFSSPSCLLPLRDVCNRMEWKSNTQESRRPMCSGSWNRWNCAYNWTITELQKLCDTNMSKEVPESSST
nr:hypothetical protein [Tanacetum cinerariifolium]